MYFEDHGIGISAKDLPLIFNRFYRAAPSNNGDAHQSGGLGLAIASAIVDVLGGKIDCHSAPGAGSKFILTLPTSAAPVAIPA